MSLRSPAARIAVFLPLLAFAGPGRAADYVDVAERRVVVPAQIGRVMAADPVAAVLVAVLAPQKLVAWPQPLSRAQRRDLPPRLARLPSAGGVGGPGRMPDAAEIARWNPDLIISGMRPTDAAIAAADRLQAQTRVPLIFVESSIERTPDMLRQIGALLAVEPRAKDLASYADHAIADLRGRMLIEPPTTRPTVYYGKGPDGLTTPRAGARALAAIDESGVIDIAAPEARGPGGEMRVTLEQLFAWNPDIIIAEERSFAGELRRFRQWRGLKAVRNRRVYAAPAEPFGWIDDPPGVNRLVGLYWLSAIMYPGNQRDLGAAVGDFYEKFYGIKLADKRLAALIRSAEAKPGEFGQSAGNPALLAPGAALNPLPPGNLPPTAPPGRGGLRALPNPTAPPLPGLPKP
jgi:iron complex transport system substrate-binding protein